MGLPCFLPPRLFQSGLLTQRGLAFRPPDATIKVKHGFYGMSGKYAGPLPANVFLKTFLPLPKSTLEAQPSRKSAFAKMENHKTEKQMYDEFRACCEKILPPDYKCQWVSTASTMDENDGSQLVEMGLYLSGHVPSPEDNRSLPRQRWDRVILYADFKSHANTNTMDPFDDGPGKRSEAVSQLRQDVRAQIAGYPAQMLAQQHRTHVFTLFILGAWVRFIRWDRSGAVFSERIHYAQCPQQISEFLWRFVNSSRQQQGYDETAEEIVKDSAEYNLMLAARDAKEEQYKLDYLKEDTDGNWPWYKLRVDAEVQPPPSKASHTGVSSTIAPRSTLDGAAAVKTEPRYFLVGKPRTDPHGLAGRATRGYIAWDVTGERLVFLKDCWRVPTLPKEGDTLLKLNGAEVPFVPTLVCHGDVGGQTTLTPEYWDKERDGEESKIKPHAHYRLVVEEIGCPLDDFRNSRELVLVIYESICAHFVAFNDAHVLHRDISAGNILIVRKTEDGVVRASGLLNDWDLAKDTEIKPAGQCGRTGTWQFMSGRLLAHPSKFHEVQDDFESFLHVLLWEAVRYLPHDGCPSVGAFMTTFFDEAYNPGDGVRGGLLKTHTFMVGKLEFTFRNPALESIINTLFGWFQGYYWVHEDLLDGPTNAGTPKSQQGDKTREKVYTLPTRLRPNKAPQVVEQAKKHEAHANIASNLNDHKQIASIFQAQLDDGDWPDHDKIPDQVEPQYTYNFLGISKTSKLTSKRAASQVADLDSDEEREPKMSRTGSRF